MANGDKKIRIPKYGSYTLDEISNLDNVSGFIDAMGAKGLRPNKMSNKNKEDYRGVRSAVNENYENKLNANILQAFGEGGVPTGLSPDQGYNLGIGSQRDLDKFMEYRKGNPNATLKDYRMSQFFGDEYNPNSKSWSSVPLDQRSKIFDIYQSGLTGGSRNAAGPKAWNAVVFPEKEKPVKPQGVQIPEQKQFSYTDLQHMSEVTGVPLQEIQEHVQNNPNLDVSQRNFISHGNFNDGFNTTAGTQVPEKFQIELPDGSMVNTRTSQLSGDGGWYGIGGDNGSFEGFVANNSIEKIGEIINNNYSNTTNSLEIVNDGITEYQNSKNPNDFFSKKVDISGFDGSYNLNSNVNRLSSGKSGFSKINSIFDLVQAGSIYNIDRVVENSMTPVQLRETGKYTDNDGNTKYSDITFGDIENLDVEGVTHIVDGKVKNLNPFPEKYKGGKEGYDPRTAFQKRGQHADNQQLLQPTRIANQIAENWMVKTFGDNKLDWENGLTKNQINTVRKNIANDTEGMSRSQKQRYHLDFAETMIKGFTYKYVSKGDMSRYKHGGSVGIRRVENLMKDVFGGDGAAVYDKWSGQSAARTKKYLNNVQASNETGVTSTND